MIMAKETNPEIVAEIVQLRESRAAALADFKARANSPKAVAESNDMAGFVQKADDAGDAIMTAVALGQFEDGVACLLYTSLRLRRGRTALTTSLWEPPRRRTRFLQRVSYLD